MRVSNSLITLIINIFYYLRILIIITALKAAQEAAARVNAKNVGASGVQRAKDIIADINARFKENSVQGTVPEADKAENAAEYSVEIEINDYPQKARWKVTNKVCFLYYTSCVDIFY